VRETRETISCKWSKQSITWFRDRIFNEMRRKEFLVKAGNMIGDGMSVDCRRCLASRFHFLAGVESLALSVPDQSPLQNSSSSGRACLHNTQIPGPNWGPTSSSILIIVLNHRIPSIWSFYFNDDFFVSRIGSSIHN
jgi:hypothetical protein